MAEEQVRKGSGLGLGLLLVAGALYGLFLAANARDPAMELHGFIFMAAATLGIFALIRRATDTRLPSGDDTRYEDGPIRAGVIASTFWGIVGFLVGLVIACQLVWPELNLGLPWTSFGRLRPLPSSSPSAATC